MSIRSVLDISDKMTDGGFSNLFDNDLRERYSRFSEEVDENFGIAKETIVSKLGEKEFCKYLNMISEHAVSRIMSSGNVELVPALQDGTLKEYTDTVVLAVIGGLIQDEVL